MVFTRVKSNRSCMKFTRQSLSHSTLFIENTQFTKCKSLLQGLTTTFASAVLPNYFRAKEKTFTEIHFAEITSVFSSSLLLANVLAICPHPLRQSTSSFLQFLLHGFVANLKRCPTYTQFIFPFHVFKLNTVEHRVTIIKF